MSDKKLPIVHARSQTEPGAWMRRESLELELAGPGQRCDADGILDAGEAGLVRVRVHNTGVVPFGDVTLALEATDPAVNIRGGARHALSGLAPGQGEEVVIPIDLDEGHILALGRAQPVADQARGAGQPLQSPSRCLQRALAKVGR